MLVSLLWATYFVKVIRGRKSSDLGLHWDIWAAGVLKALDAACEECDDKNATDNDFLLHIMETLWSGGLKNVFV